MVCSRCGSCCKTITITSKHRHLTESDKKYWEFRGIKLERLNREVDRMIIPCRCIHLGEDNLCKIWETRPDMCRKEFRRTKGIYVPSECTDERR